jgi:hypothetical protein
MQSSFGEKTGTIWSSSRENLDGRHSGDPLDVQSASRLAKISQEADNVTGCILFVRNANALMEVGSVKSSCSARRALHPVQT